MPLQKTILQCFFFISAVHFASTMHNDFVDMTCHVCNESFYCNAGLQYQCPQNSLADYPLASNITDCICNNGYEASSNRDSCFLGLAPFYYIDGVKYSCIEHKLTILDGAAAVSSCVCQHGLYGGTGNSLCTPCDSGYYADEYNMTACKLCPAHSFVDNSDKIIAATNVTECLCNAAFTGRDGGPCYACAAGKYKGIAGSTECEPCAKDTFSTGEATQCTACPFNSTSAVGSISIHNCSCDPGFYRVLLNGEYYCEKCPSGRYKNYSGNLECDFCEKNYISPYTGATACVSCNANSRANKGDKNNHNSSAFETGIGGDHCLCNAGYYVEHDETLVFEPGVLPTCIACAADTFQANFNQPYCENCPLHSYSEVASTHLNLCMCNAGYYESDVLTCSQCARGTYKEKVVTNEKDTDACQKCPKNTTSPTGSSNLLQCICKVGFTGSDGEACDACVAGTYKNVNGSSACLLCPQNSFATQNLLTGTTVCTLCSEFMQSPHAITNGVGTEHEGGCGCDYLTGFGEFVNDSYVRTCKICAAGKFSNETYVRLSGLSSPAPRSICTECIDGTFAVVPGTVICQHCYANSLSYDSPHVGCQCNAGFSFDAALTLTMPAGFAICNDCVEGKFKDFYGNVHCSQCQNHSTSATTSVNQTACQCLPGYYENMEIDTRGHTCQACAAGYFNAESDAEACIYCDDVTGFRSYTPIAQFPYSSVEACFACLVCNTSTNANFVDHYDNAREGLGCGETVASQCIECPQNSSLFEASTHSNWNAGVLNCVCDRHYYGPAGVACAMCPVDRGRSAHVEYSTILDCKCLAGSEPAGVSTPENMATCLPCDIAKYKEDEADTACLQCPSTLTTEFVGASNASLCVCEPGKFMLDASLSFELLQCEPCPRATYADTFTRNEQCTACFDHSTSASGSAYRQNCSCLPGFEMLGVAATTGLCSACAAGNAKNITANSACEPCAQDQFSFVQASAVCLNCPEQSSTVGQIKQIRCACVAGHEEMWLQSLLSVQMYAASYEPTMRTIMQEYSSQLHQAFMNPPVCVPCRLGTYKHAAAYAEFEIVFVSDPITVLSSTSCVRCSRCGDTFETGQVARECNSTHDIACKACQANSVPVADSEFLGPCLCVAGYELVQENGEYECRACAPGFYRNVDNNNSIGCLPCPDSTFTGSYASVQCNACTQHCDDVDETTFFVQTECNSTRDIICQACQICQPAFYAQHQCGVNYFDDRRDTKCVHCPENFFCPGEAISVLPVPCPSFSSSENYSVSVHDCSCNAGRYFYNDSASADIICEVCPFDTYCPTGSLAPTDCPTHSITTHDENAARTSCNCLARYYRYPENYLQNSLHNFTCALCTENDFCFNNTRFDCPDDLMRLPVGQYSADNCTCIPRYYNNGSKCEVCKVDHYCIDGQQFECPQHEWTNGLRGQNLCLCRPGYRRNAIGVCEICNTSVYCDGTSDTLNPYTCPQNSLTSAEGQASIAACLCLPGFQNSSVPMHEQPHTCVACTVEQLIANTSAVVPGTYKATHANEACRVCTICDPERDFVWTSVQCTLLSDAQCESCVHCHDVNATHDRLKYETHACQRFKNTQCANCTACDLNYEWEFQDCLELDNRICKNISFDRQCLPGFYAGSHTETTDSNCSACLYHDTLYQNKRMHVAVSPGQIYNDPYSCNIECLSFSKFVDPSNVSLGCVTCETGNVLFKNLIQDPNNFVCNFTCRPGYVERRNDDGLDGDCDLGVLPDTSAYYNHAINVSSIQRVARSDTFLLDHVTDQQILAAFRLRLTHTSHSNFIIVVGDNEPTCTGREQRHINLQCCFANLFRISTKTQMGLSTTKNETCTRNPPLWHTSITPTITEFEIPDDRLKSVGLCKSNGTEVLDCEITISIIDLSLFQYSSVTARLQVTRGAALATVSGEHRYIPLYAFSVDVFLAYKESNTNVFAIVSSMQSLPASIYDGQTKVSVRGVGMQFLQPNPELNCARLQVGSYQSSASINTWTLQPGSSNTSITFFAMNKNISTVTLFYTLNLLDRPGNHIENLMDIAVWRNISDKQYSVCAYKQTTKFITQGEIFSASGLGESALLQMARLADATHAVTGELGGLTSFIARALYTHVANVNLVSMLTAGTLAPASHLLAGKNITSLHNGQLKFDYNFQQSCLASQACFYQYLQYDVHGNALYTFKNCSASSQQQAVSWIQRIFGVSHDHGHIAGLCRRAEKNMPRGGIYQYEIVLVNTRAYMPAARAWYDLQNRTTAYNIAKVYALFRFT